MPKVELLQAVVMAVNGKYTELQPGDTVEVPDGKLASMVSNGQARPIVDKPEPHDSPKPAQPSVSVEEGKKGGGK